MKINLTFDFEILLDLNSILQVHKSTVDKMNPDDNGGNDEEYAKRILRARKLLELPMNGRQIFEKPLFGAFSEPEPPRESGQ
jgi:hypothetical protein